MKVRTKQNIHNHVYDKFDHQNLLADAIYEVIGISDEYYRIVNEVGEPILYPQYLFEVIDPSIPETWVRQDYEDGEYYIDPPELCDPRLYEDLFDRKPYAIAIFKKYLADHEV